MTTITTETEWISGLAPELLHRFFARLSFNLTVAGRNSYETGTDELSNPRQLRTVNEVQHRLSACLSQLLESRCPDGFVHSIAQIVFTHREDDELTQMLRWSWVQAQEHIRNNEITSSIRSVNEQLNNLPEMSITLNLPYDLSEKEWAKVLATYRSMDGWIEDQSCWFGPSGSNMFVDASAEPSGLLITARMEISMFIGWTTKLCAKLTAALGREVFDAEV